MEFTWFDHDQASDAEFAEAAEFMAGMDAVDRPWFPQRSAAQVADFLRDRLSGNYHVSLWSARDGAGTGRLTAVAWLNVPKEAENAQSAVVSIRVDPALRRRGIATEFLRTLIPQLRAAKCDRLIGMVDSRGSGELWGATVGLAPTLRYVQQVLRFADKDPSLWDRRLAPGYRLETWGDHAPDDLLASYAVARQAMEDSVSGDLSWKHPQWTPERVRADEARLSEVGNHCRVVVAVDEADGEIAGITQVMFPATNPLCAQQVDTAVRREHRGRGLGLAIKAAQLRALAERPGMVEVATQTADLHHMAVINRALGFRDVVESVYVEADFGAIEAVLASGS
jgi:GNAT superfamily N-acetyltransferase